MPSRFRDTSLGWRWYALAPLAALSGIVATASAHASMPALPDGACRVETVAGERYTICTFDPAAHRISLRLNGWDGAPYRKLPKLTDARPNAVFAMNGGMYHDDLSAVGLYVEDGAEAESLKTKPSWGNFGLVPNGVFWVRGQRAGVTETLRFRRRGVKPDFATQSGPMLVIDGRLHPRFKASSRSFKVRNGVGVGEDGRVHFALSHGSVNFHSFAKMFRDHLATPNALFLDGTISSMRAKGFTRGGFWAPVGPIIVVEEPVPTTPKARPKS